MTKLIGYFILMDETPHLIVTNVSALLQSRHTPAPPPVEGIVNMAQAPCDSSDAASAPPAPPTPQWGQWPVISGDGEQQVQGLLYPLVNLGFHGRRLALESALKNRSLPLEQAMLLVRLDPNDELIGWARYRR